jgi:hypothetical protein
VYFKSPQSNNEFVSFQDQADLRRLFCEKEDMGSEVSVQYVNLLKNIKLTTDYSQDRDGCTALHLLVKRMKWISPDAVLQLASHLKSVSKRDIQDNEKRTALHILSSRVAVIGAEAFLALAECMKSPSNLNLQDSTGKTVLHYLSNAVFAHPELGPSILPVLSQYATKENVNMSDKDLCTPYAFIMSARHRWMDFEPWNNVVSKDLSQFCKQAFSSEIEIDEHTGQRGFIPVL